MVLLGPEEQVLRIMVGDQLLTVVDYGLLLLILVLETV
jgi:hypothetical protein